MGLLDSKSSSSQADGSNNSNSQTGSGVTLLPTITAGDDIKNMSLTNNVNVSYLDNDAIEQAFNFSKDSFSSTTLALENISTGAFNAVSDASNGATMLSEMALNTVETAMFANKDLSELSIMNANESVQTMANLSLSFGDKTAYLADGAMASSERLAADFGDDLFTISSQNNEILFNSITANQSLADSVINFSAMLSSEAMENNKALASDFGFNLASITESSINRNAELVNNFGLSLADITQGQQMALTEMAVLQERGLDNALEIAGSLGTNDNTEASSNMIKYISMGLAVVGAAMVLRK